MITYTYFVKTVQYSFVHTTVYLLKLYVYLNDNNQYFYQTRFLHHLGISENNQKLYGTKEL